jgi:uncharacterized protein (TIGR02996 family)
MPARKRPPEDDALLAGVLAAPRDDAPRLVYADWLDERADPRGDYLRTEIELAGLNPKNPTAARLRDRLRRLRAKLPAAWLAALDRPDVMRADPTPFDPEWWGPVLVGCREPRSALSFDYGFRTPWAYDELPPLPAAASDGRFDWLPAATAGGPRPAYHLALARLEAEAKRRRVRLPPAFVDFFEDRVADWPADQAPAFALGDLVPFREADGGCRLRFGSSGGTDWHLFLAPGRYHCVIAAERPADEDEEDEDRAFAVEYDEAFDSPDWETDDPDRWEDVRPPAGPPPLRAADCRFVAPTFDAFLYRHRLEAGLARMLTRRPRVFTPAEGAYFDHYKLRGGR